MQQALNHKHHIFFQRVAPIIMNKKLIQCSILFIYVRKKKYFILTFEQDSDVFFFGNTVNNHTVPYRFC